MIIIIGGEPELSCGMARRSISHDYRREGVVCAHPRIACVQVLSRMPCDVPGVLPLAAVFPLPSCDCVVPYVPAVSSLLPCHFVRRLPVARWSLAFHSTCVSRVLLCLRWSVSRSPRSSLRECLLNFLPFHHHYCTIHDHA